MPPFRYIMVSTVACEADYLPEAGRHVAAVMGELREALPQMGAHFGVFVSGRHAGSMALIHLYRELNDIEPAFAVYGASPNFAKAAGSGRIALRERNLVRLADTGAAEAMARPAYQLFLRYGAPGLAAEATGHLIDAALDAGSAWARHGTVWTGTIAGSQLVTLGCPSSETATSAEAACVRAVGALPERDLLRVDG